MFNSANFIFNEIPSENYGIQILDFERTSGVTNSSAGNATEIIEKRIYKRTKPYHFGNSQTIPMTFNLTIGASDFISAIDVAKISKWLLGKSGYLKFQVDQDDIGEIYWNVIFTSGEVIYVGRKPVGLLLHAQTDSPWAYTFPRSINYSFPIIALQNFDFTFYNDSDDNCYLYPIIEFNLNSLGADFTISNATDNNREFTFSGLSPLEEISVDNDLKIITSSTGLHRLSYFNKNWFRLLPGVNELNVSGAIEWLDIQYQFARTVGI